jgi:phosphoglycerate dehydrogenase-like enzyme
VIILLDEAYRDGVGHRFDGHDVRYFPSSITSAESLIAAMRDADVVGFRRVLPFPFEAAMVENAPRLKYLHRSGSGADWFDVPLCSRLGIMVAVNSGFNAPSVAEHTVELTLLCLRRTLDFIASMTAGEWLRDLPDGEPPMMLNGKTVGVIGIGNIGGRVARAMIALGANVVAYQRDTSVSLPEGASWVDFDTLVSTADVITLHVPLLPETTRMIGAREFGMMKRTAVLINTSRGTCIDQAALIEAIESRRIRAAGLDVFEEEPLARDHPLRHMRNVIVTPHVGGTGIEIVHRQVEGTLSNIDLFVAGKRPLRLVNPEILRDGRARAKHLLES